MTSILSQLPLPAIPAVLPVLLFLAKATLLLLLALIGAAALRRASAGARHMVWIGALASVVLLPAISRWLPWRLVVIPSSLGAVTGAAIPPGGRLPGEPVEPDSFGAPTAQRAIQHDQASAPASRQLAAIPATQSRIPETSQPRGESVAARRVPASHRGTLSSGALGGADASDIWAALTALWVLGTLALLARLVLGMATVRRIVRAARPLDSREWAVPLWEVADRLDLARAPRLLSSDEVSMPFACGLFRPAVVLPTEASGWSDDRRRAVLFHELAHVRRCDLVGHTLGRIACALYWFHPLVWAAARRLRSESERACDDLVLNSGTRASDYAHHLLEIVTGVRNASAPATALAMARRKEFEGRMLAILDPEQRRAAPGRVQAAVLVLGLAALTLSVSAMAPAGNGRDLSVADSTRLAHDSLAARNTATSLPSPVADTDAASRQRSVAVADTGDDTTSRTIERAVTSSVERSDERAVEEVAEEIAGARYSGLLSDRNNFAPRIDSYSLDEVRRAIRTSMREGLGESMRGNAASQHGDSGTTDLLVKLLQSDSDAKVRRTAAWALAQRDERDSRAVTAALASALAHDSDSDVREMAAWGLGQGNGDTAVQALRDAIQHDADERVKTTAAWALGTIGDAASSAALDAAMADPSARVRSRAAWALGQIEPDKAPRGLVTALGDSSDKVRLAAAWALGQIEDPETLSAISQALSTEKDHDIREAELRALILLGEASEATLQKLLESPDPDVRLKVTRAIVGFRGVRPWPWPMPMPRPTP